MTSQAFNPPSLLESLTMKTLALLPFLALAACSPKAEPPAEPKVTVADAWCRPAPAGALSGACYLTLTAATDDRLTAVESPAAGSVEIHTMEMTGGIMRMRQLSDGLEIPKTKPVDLKPGADHLMLIGPKAAFALGAQVPLTLSFQKAPAVTVQAEVRRPPLPTDGAAQRH